jgi:hypothetical protein
MLTGYEAYIRKFENGCGEVYTPEIHLNLIAKEPHNLAYVGWNDKYCKYAKDPAVRESFKKVGSQETRRYDVEYINDFVKCAVENGYLCTHNHPYWSMEDWKMIEQYEGFFSMEMCNYSSFLLNGLEYNADLYDYLLRRGKRIFCHSADDNHNGKPFGDPGCDSFGGFTMIKAPSLDYDKVGKALLDGHFYASEGPLIHSLWVEDGYLHVTCSEAVQVTMNTGIIHTDFKKAEGGRPVTEAAFRILPEFRYVRLTVLDGEGHHACTNAYFTDTLPL